MTKRTKRNPARKPAASPAKAVRATRRKNEGVLIRLPPDVISAIEGYIKTDWPIGSVGALNAVAFIGERVVAVYDAGGIS